MSEVYESCTICVVIRCMEFAPKLTIRRKCIHCNHIQIIGWATKYDYASKHPGQVTVRKGECPMGQPIATEYLKLCPNCEEKNYRQRRKERGWS